MARRKYDRQLHRTKTICIDQMQPRQLPIRMQTVAMPRCRNGTAEIRPPSARSCLQSSNYCLYDAQSCLYSAQSCLCSALFLPDWPTPAYTLQIPAYAVPIPANILPIPAYISAKSCLYSAICMNCPSAVLRNSGSHQQCQSLNGGRKRGLCSGVVRRRVA